MSDNFAAFFYCALVRDAELCACLGAYCVAGTATSLPESSSCLLVLIDAVPYLNSKELWYGNGAVPKEITFEDFGRFIREQHNCKERPSSIPQNSRRTINTIANSRTRAAVHASSFRHKARQDSALSAEFLSICRDKAPIPSGFPLAPQQWQYVRHAQQEKQRKVTKKPRTLSFSEWTRVMKSCGKATKRYGTTTDEVTMSLPKEVDTLAMRCEPIRSTIQVKLLRIWLCHFNFPSLCVFVCMRFVMFDLVHSGSAWNDDRSSAHPRTLCFCHGKCRSKNLKYHSPKKDLPQEHIYNWFWSCCCPALIRVELLEFLCFHMSHASLLACRLCFQINFNRCYQSWIFFIIPNCLGIFCCKWHILNAHVECHKCKGWPLGNGTSWSACSGGG